MKLFFYSLKNNPQKRLGYKINDLLVDPTFLAVEFPKSLNTVFENWAENFETLKRIEQKLWRLSFTELQKHGLNESEIIFHPPTTTQCTFRDFYAFLQHVKSARALRGLGVIDEWYEIPVFYFSNPNVFIGHNSNLEKPAYTDELDLELEIACIIGKEGKDIPVEKAADYIAGYTILNDFSARDVQRKEMRVGLGPAKSKDFATGLGPLLVTPDELTDLEKNKGFNLQMSAYKNGRQISNGNFSDIHFSFYEMIARASHGVTLFPGDVIGSGTVGTGCILELRPESTNGWLEPGDEIELRIEKLGKLKNFIK